MSEKENYTDRQNWEDYWENYIPEKCQNFYLEKFLPKLPQGSKLIEIGGFPGKIASFFKREFKFDVTILDYFIDDKIINMTEIINDIPPNSINIIEADFFKYKTNIKYDIVCSVGFIEHFENLENTIKRHKEYLKPSGILLISLPNFLGVNGKLQKIIDPKNLSIHNLNVMNINYLSKCCNKANLKNVEVVYYGGFGIWLENSAPCSNVVKRTIKIINKYFSYFFKNILKVESKAFSPYIVVRATI